MMSLWQVNDFSANATATEQFVGELPPSPTAALWTTEEETEQRKRATPRKTVSFAEDVKDHDGLTVRNAIFDRLICAYFVEQREISELDILTFCGQDLAKIVELHEDLVDMVERISEAVENGRQAAPVLPRGGGLCTKLCPPHVPYVKVLDRVVEAAANRVLKAQAQGVALVL